MFRFAMTGLVAAVLCAEAVPALAQDAKPSIWMEGDIAASSAFATAAPDPTGRGVGTSGFAGGISVPITFGEGRTTVTVGASYRMRRFQPSRLPAAAGAEPTHLHEVNTEVMVRRAVSERWALTAVVSGGLAGDFEGDFDLRETGRLQGAVLAARVMSPRLTLGAGAVYGSGFGVSIPLPLLLAEWNDGGRWRAGGLLPSHAGVWYRASGALEVGMQGRLEGGWYTTNGLFAAAEPRVQLFVARVGPSVTWRPTARAALSLFAGAAYQQTRFQDGTRDLPGGNHDREPAFFSAARLELAF